MLDLPILAVDLNITWYAIPLSVVISLVYSSTRYEMTERILQRSLKLFVTIMICLVVAFVVLWALSFRL